MFGQCFVPSDTEHYRKHSRRLPSRVNASSVCEHLFKHQVKINVNLYFYIVLLTNFCYYRNDPSLLLLNSYGGEGSP